MIPLSLEQLLAASMEAIGAHPQHALLPIRRRAIYAALGPLGDPQAFQRRERLDIITAQHVLPLWHEERPTDDRAEHLLALVQTIMDDQVDMQAAQEDVEAIWRWLTEDDGGRYEKLSTPVYYALGAAIAAAVAALEGNPLLTMRLDENETDANIDLASSDCAKWAANAVAGPVWKPDSDSAKRLEFWTWWLTEAVPAAWNAVD